MSAEGARPREPGGGRPQLERAGEPLREARVVSAAVDERMNLQRKYVEIFPLRYDLQALGSTRCWFCFLFRLCERLGSES